MLMFSFLGIVFGAAACYIADVIGLWLKLPVLYELGVAAVFAVAFPLVYWRIEARQNKPVVKSCGTCANNSDEYCAFFADGECLLNGTGYAHWIPRNERRKARK